MLRTNDRRTTNEKVADELSFVSRPRSRRQLIEANASQTGTPAKPYPKSTPQKPDVARLDVGMVDRTT
jgi:hypothetical protein